jgi:predicted protein tyrosine phosphatase
MIIMKGVVSNTGQKIAVIAMSRFEIESFDYNNPFRRHVVISITDPDESDAVLKSNPKAILRLKFWDLNDVKEDMRDGRRIVYDVLFENKDAKSIRRFVEKHLSKTDSIVVHCHAGISRSVGTAAAIAKHLFNNDETFYKLGRPNSRVYSKLLAQFVTEEAEPTSSTA